MFFHYPSHPFHTLSSEIDLRTSPHLQLLQFDLHLHKKNMRKSQGDMILWFNSICSGVQSKSLVIEVSGFSEEVEICNKIQDTLLALNARIETLSVQLFCSYSDASTTKKRRKKNCRKLFPKLYEKGVVVERRRKGGKLVCSYFLTSKLPY